MDSYTVKPRKTRDGFNLESDALSHGFLWYVTTDSAIGFAQWHSRVKGGEIALFNEKNEVIQTERFAPGDFAY